MPSKLNTKLKQNENNISFLTVQLDNNIVKNFRGGQLASATQPDLFLLTITILHKCLAFSHVTMFR